MRPDDLDAGEVMSDICTDTAFKGTPFMGILQVGCATFPSDSNTDIETMNKE